MRQRRWLELIKDYDLEILYPPGKANVVANALSKKRKDGIAALLTSQKPSLEEMRKLNLEVTIETVEAKLASLRLRPTLIDQIKEAQWEDPERKGIVNVIDHGSKTDLNLDDNEVIRYGSRLWVPNSRNLRKEILKEAHSSAYSIHLGSTKMYKDLKKYYWWENMK